MNSKSKDALVKSISVLRMQPGDVLLLELRADLRLSAEMLARMKYEVEAVLPAGVRAILLEGGIVAKRLTIDDGRTAEAMLESLPVARGTW